MQDHAHKCRRPAGATQAHTLTHTQARTLVWLRARNKLAQPTVTRARAHCIDRVGHRVFARLSVRAQSTFTSVICLLLASTSSRCSLARHLLISLCALVLSGSRSSQSKLVTATRQAQRSKAKQATQTHATCRQSIVTQAPMLTTTTCAATTIARARVWASRTEAACLRRAQRANPPRRVWASSPPRPPHCTSTRNRRLKHNTNSSNNIIKNKQTRPRTTINRAVLPHRRRRRRRRRAQAEVCCAWRCLRAPYSP